MENNNNNSNKHKEFDKKFVHLLNDDTRKIPYLDKSTNLKELLIILQETGKIFNLNEEPNNVHNGAYDTVQYVRFILESSTNENNE